MRLIRAATRAALLSTFAAAAACKGSEPPSPTSVAVTPAGPLNFASFNATTQLSASVLDQNGNPMAGLAITWTSNSPSVATVDTTGLVTSKSNGSATVTAAFGAIIKTVPVTVGQVAATLAKTGGDAQSGVSGGPLSQPVAVRLTDAAGTAVYGATISFAVVAGGGQVSNSTVPTSATGDASIIWTLGASGAQQVSATVGALNAAFNATVVASSASPLVGAGQIALIGYPTNIRPAIRLAGAGNAPVSGAQVTFAVASGGGSVTGATTTTDVNGVAQVGKWTLGASAGSNTLTATVTGAGIANNPVTFTATGVNAGFTITIQNTGPAFSPGVKAAFDSAVAFWQRTIYQTSGTSTVTSGTGQCGQGSPAINQSVKDLLILARIDSIDGPGKVLGSAGPCQVHPISGLTRLGTMRFDSADMNNLFGNGQLNEVIRHEMGHVLGFGTLWDPSTGGPVLCIGNVSSPGTLIDTYFSCDHARAAFDTIGGASYTGGLVVPVENCGPASPAGCGAGTIDSHWREPVFTNELMTGYLDTGTTNPVSLVTIAAMEDIGYTVNYGAAETYVHTFSSPPAVRSAPVLVELKDDVYRGPIYTTDRTGRLVRIDRRP